MGIDVKQPSTMGNDAWKHLGYYATGILAQHSIGQSSFMWFCRTLPTVKKVPALSISLHI
jgi:hypothetical protein